MYIVQLFKHHFLAVKELKCAKVLEVEEDSTLAIRRRQACLPEEQRDIGYSLHQSALQTQ